MVVVKLFLLMHRRVVAMQHGNRHPWMPRLNVFAGCLFFIGPRRGKWSIAD